MSPNEPGDGLAETMRPDAGPPPAERETLLAHWAGTLKPDVDPGATIRRPLQDTPARVSPPSIRRLDSTGTPLGPSDYRLLDVLGKGGMGVVYQARQDCLDRLVAVKMLNTALAGDVDARMRFHSEALATGELQHPNIVPVYELGQTAEGHLFYAMPQVHGRTWAPREQSRAGNLDILLRVADAVAFAHSKGVVHRDLKPANVMLGAFGEVLVMDWGLAASVVDDGRVESLERASASGGSPAYMAPEQALGDHARIGFRTDVYLLGAVLFEILAGAPPHPGRNLQEAIESAARNRIRPTDEQGELMSVARHALADRPEDRIPSVKEFQLAIREYLAHTESVALAERASRELLRAVETNRYEGFAKSTYLFQESLALWPEHAAAREGEFRARTQHAASALDHGDLDLAASLLEDGLPGSEGLRKRLDVAQRERIARQRWLGRLKWSSAALAVALVVAFTVSYVLIRDERDVAKRARDRARQAHREEIAQRQAAETARLETTRALDQAEREAYAAQIGLAAQKISELIFTPAREVLGQCAPRLRQWEWRRLAYLCHLDEWTLDGAEGPANAACFLRDGREAWVGSDDGQLRQVDVETGLVRGALRAPTSILCVAATAGDDRRVLAGCGDGIVRIWDEATGKAVGEFRADLNFVKALAFAPDHASFATSGGEGVVRIWKPGQEKPLLELRGHAGPVFALAFVPKTTLLVTGGFDRTVRLWDLTGGTCLHTFDGHTQMVFAVAVRPDGRQVASAGKDGPTRLWDLETRRALGTFCASEVATYAVAYTPDGHQLLSSGFNQVAKLWSPAGEGDVEHVFQGHSQPVYTAVFSPDGSRLLTGSADGTFKLWRTTPPRRASEPLLSHDSAVLELAFSRDGRLLSGDDAGTAVLTEVSTGREIRRVNAHGKRIHHAAFSSDDRRWLTASQDGAVKIWDSVTGEAVFPLAIPDGTGAALTGRWSLDGRYLVTGHADGSVRLWDGATGTSMAAWTASTEPVSCAECSPDGRHIATAGFAREIKIWETATRRLERTLSGHRGAVTALRFSCDGRWLVSSSRDQTACIWDLSDGTARHVLHGHLKDVMGVALSPDGQRIFTSSADATVRIWAFDSGRELLMVPDYRNGVMGMALSPSGDTLVTSGLNGSVWYWPVK